MKRLFTQHAQIVVRITQDHAAAATKSDASQASCKVGGPAAYTTSNLLPHASRTRCVALRKFCVSSG